MTKFGYPLCCSRKLKKFEFTKSYLDIDPNTLLDKKYNSKFLLCKHINSTLLVPCVSPCSTQGYWKLLTLFYSYLPVVPCKNVYNCILLMPFAATLDVVASSVHIKFKYHNLQEEPIKINID